MAKPLFNLARVCTRPVRQSIFDFARYASIAGALCATSPVFAGSDEENLANQTGDDPTHPLGKIELLDRFTTAPGPGAPGCAADLAAIAEAINLAAASLLERYPGEAEAVDEPTHS